MHKKENVAVFFGGISPEHEISIITALQAIKAIDTCQYSICPVYISTEGVWYTGNALFEKKFYQKKHIDFSSLLEVTLLPKPHTDALFPLKNTYVDLKNPIPIDLCFLCFHGKHGEDGCIQGLLEMADIPYTGCSLLSSAVSMDKYICSRFLMNHNIPCLPSHTLTRDEVIHSFDQVTSREDFNHFPLIVKPCHLGSSIGLTIAHNKKELQIGIAKAFNYDTKVIVEPYLANLLEINVAVIDSSPPFASVVEIPVSAGKGLLSFDDKYLRGGSKTSESCGMASLTRVIDPKDLSDEIKQTVTDLALKSFNLLSCSGAVRFDFMFDTESETLYFNELNPIPGSLAYYLFEKSNPPYLYTEIIDKILKSAKKKRAEKLSLTQKLPFKALKHQ